MLFELEPTEVQDRPTPFVSTRLPYGAVIPPGWIAKEVTADDGQQADIFFVTESGQAIAVLFTASANPRLYEGVEEAARTRGLKLVSRHPIRVAGSDGRLYRFNRRRLLRKEQIELDAAFAHGPYCWQIALLDGTGDGSDEGLLRAFLDNFTPTDVLLARDDPSGNIWALQPGDCFRSLPFDTRPGELTEFWGGVDGFAKVGRDDPHTGMVAMKYAEVPETWDLQAEDPNFSWVLCLPIEGTDKPPEDVKAVLVLAHPAGMYTGPHHDETDAERITMAAMAREAPIITGQADLSGWTVQLNGAPHRIELGSDSALYGRPTSFSCDGGLPYQVARLDFSAVTVPFTIGDTPASMSVSVARLPVVERLKRVPSFFLGGGLGDVWNFELIVDEHRLGTISHEPGARGSREST